MIRRLLIPMASFLLSGGGMLQAQTGLLDRASFSITVSEKVEFQVVDAQGRYTGMDFQAKAVHVGLPDTTYDPYEGLDDDVSGEPDPNPIQYFDGFFEQAQQYTLRMHPKASGAFKGEVILTDRKTKSRRIKFTIIAKKDLVVQEYRLLVDPMRVDQCSLVRIKH